MALSEIVSKDLMSAPLRSFPICIQVTKRYTLGSKNVGSNMYGSVKSSLIHCDNRDFTRLSFPPSHLLIDTRLSSKSLPYNTSFLESTTPRLDFCASAIVNSLVYQRQLSIRPWCSPVLESQIIWTKIPSTLWYQYHARSH
jgi:hypothetical protein